MAAAAQTKLAPAQPGMTPWKVIQTYSPAEWEEFTEEWSKGFEPPYHQVVRLGGSGDKGRDVVGYTGPPQDGRTKWDSYQCKHYDHPLRPTDIYCELGKMCVYTHRGDFPVPRKYRFVAPKGVGTKLHDLLKKPDEIRRELIANWAGYCESGISDAEKFPLTGALRKYVGSFNFKIVWFLTPHEILEQHRKTQYWHQRFKIEPPPRPDNPPPPTAVQAHEQEYINRLLAAYASRLRRAVTCPDDIQTAPELHAHFRRSRGFFFAAEALGRFSRDHFPGGSFDGVKRHIHDGVIDVTIANHADGFQCVLAVAGMALALQLPQSDLLPYVAPADRVGMCHHLANDGHLKWVQ